MVSLSYKGTKYGTNDPTYVVKNGLIIELNRLRDENEKEKTLRSVLSPYGPLYKPTLLEELLDEIKPSDEKLEERVRLHIGGGSRFIQYAKNLSSGELNEFLGKTERLIEVDYLPEFADGRVLGMYDPNNDTIYVLKNLRPDVKKFVMAHERAHRRRHFVGESQDEYMVDLEAMAEVGYDPLKRFSGGSYSRAA